jgi:predicted P-loop ATPase
MSNISIFSKVFDKTPSGVITFDDYLSGIKIGRWEDVVLSYRNGKIKKELIPCVTASGTFTQRSYKGLEQHSDIINIDIDAKDNPEIDVISLRDNLFTDPYILAGHVSVSGKGLSLYVKINGKKHYESYCAIEKYFANTYHIIIDSAAKDIPRLRFVSLDPELHHNKKSKKWTEYLEKEKTPPPSYSHVSSSSDFDYVMQQITGRSLNIAEDYDDWVKIACSIISKFGSNGRDYFHTISSMSTKYDRAKCDKKYDLLLKSGSNKTNISTFFWYAKNAGCEIKSTRTKEIEKVAKIRAKQVGKSGGYETKDQAMREAQKYLSEVAQIDGKDVEEILEQVKDLPDRELQEKTDTQEKIDIIMQIIKDKKLKLNEITGNIEGIDGVVTDNLVNSYYLDCLNIDDCIKKEFFTTILFSNRVQKFDPFKEFIKKYKHLKPEGNIQKLLDCLNDDMAYDDQPICDYKEIYVYKWLISIMASIHGTYSLMILVLTGEQMIEKTNFFRSLLPKELRCYYGESKLDAGKDDEILMTQKLILCDDEFGGKSKQEAKKLKDLSSKQYFSIRRPYARIPEDIRRIAVLCGTSNDDDIINDPTGNRRILPLKIKSIDKEKLAEIDKTELFMEMYHEWKKIGDGWMLTKYEVEWLNKIGVKHEQDVAEFDLIQKYYTSDPLRIYDITTTDIKVFIESVTQQKLSLYKIGQSLRKLGYERKAKYDLQGKKLQVWNVQKS